MSHLIDPATVAVLFADLQDGIVDASQTAKGEDVVKHAAAMAEVTKVLGIPALIQLVQAGPNQPRAADDLLKALPQAPVHVRQSAHAFEHGPTRDWFQTQGRKIIAISGIASEIVVLNAVLGARDLGYDVHVLVDAVGGLTDRSERAAFNQIERAGAVLSSVPSFATAMVPSFAEPKGMQVLGALRAVMS